MRYRSFRKDNQGRLIGLPDIIDCDNDATAMGWAESWSKFLCDGTAVEVWQGSRLVARLHRRADGSAHDARVHFAVRDGNYGSSS